MDSFLNKRKWSAYWVGAAIGFLLIGSVAFFDKILGTSKAVTTLAAFIQSIFVKQYTLSLSYFSQYLTGMPVFDFQLAVILGVFFGAFVSSYLSGRQVNFIPSLWKKNFGTNKVKRGLTAFVGGMIVIFGARLAGGCTSGQVISGASRLAAAGWIFSIGLFVAGIITAKLIYKKS